MMSCSRSCQPDSASFTFRKPGPATSRFATNPPASPSLDEHVNALTAIYDEARTGPKPTPQFEAVDAQRRLAFLMKQRDTAMSQLIPPGGPQ